ncbi:MAG: peptidoglycan recognition family protein, partial [Actinomycetota bacterium]
GGALAAKVRAAVARRTQPSMVRLTQSRGVIRVSPTFSRASQGSAPESNAWQYIVIHHSATPSGNATSFDAVHRRKAWDGLAYHFVINNGKGNPDGHLEVSSRWGAQKHGAHAGALPGLVPADVRNGFNEFGIGICLVGNFQKSKPSEKQLRTLAVLIQELRAEFGIPMANVLGHGHVKGTACPGSAFPWKKLFALMEAPTPARHKHAPVRTTARCPWCLVQDSEK